MNHADHNLVLLFHYSVDPGGEESFLRDLLVNVLNRENFCQVHELAGRNRITRKKFRLLRMIRRKDLPSFHFLINRN